MENTNIFRATQDPFVDEPREDFDAVVTVVQAGDMYFRVPTSDDVEDGPTRAYLNARNKGHGRETALKVANRYSRVFGAGYEVAITYATGYSQGDWWDILATGPEAEAATDLFTYYLRGDVYDVTEYEVKTCDLGHDHEEEVDGLFGIYADSEAEAIEAYKESNTRGELVTP